jgi:hypothetical protein
MLKTVIAQTMKVTLSEDEDDIINVTHLYNIVEDEDLMNIVEDVDA